MEILDQLEGKLELSDQLEGKLEGEEEDGTRTRTMGYKPVS